MKYEEAKALADKIQAEWKKTYPIIHIESIANFSKPMDLIDFKDLPFCITQILMRVNQS